MTVAAYVRVSTSDQNAELQVRELRACAQHQGWEVGEVYQDMISGAKTGAATAVAQPRREST